VLIKIYREGEATLPSRRGKYELRSRFEWAEDGRMVVWVAEDKRFDDASV